MKNDLLECKKSGWHKLVEAVLMNYTVLIKHEHTYKKIYGRFKSHELWLLKQADWIDNDKLWFSAFSSYFDFDEEKIKTRFINLVNEALEIYGHKTN